ncbi:ADP-ribosylglycohydrolase family protein [Sphingomonas sp.]|jgi:ADP-ribosyl-[dinitrogen reductase] hydrolase|uniref:ADP-ribosylglycohydrolase family protein n=1 Tax=Sphingomonas sp. TaxID=28214 RepID=UPI002DE53E66|nr:ADP-ribosylglycohydrolase family protein [Sphingomonas sp.]
MTGTSLSHPLQIATVDAGPGMGRIGVTFCPGKKQPGAMTGAWDRDLGLDLDAVTDWGAVTLVSLIEDHEMRSLRVEALGDEVRARHMDWVHLPIRDVSTPCSKFEQSWVTVGEGLRARLRAGFDIVVHCKGGLGRAGTIAARLLAELGADPGKAIDAVREVRNGALETPGQVRHVLTLKALPELQPDASDSAIRDRAVGALLGLAVGDAVGTTLEFCSRDSYEPLTDLVGGGPFRLKPGEWTDDTAMAMALADSLAANPDLDEHDLMTRFVDWHERGTYSCTGRCFDIGITTRQALGRFKASGDPIAGSTDPYSAGNGSLMRLAPVALAHWRNRQKLAAIAARQSATTHAAPEAVSACAIFADMLADAISGAPRSHVLRSRSEGVGKVREVMKGSWRGKPRQDVKSSGYVIHALEAAIWSVARTADFRSAVLLAANLGDDADTTAAIAGQLGGALYGKRGIPADWLEKLAWRARIEAIADQLAQ